ncbi:MAG TPA: hypothetical protein VIL69_15045 [Roseomonas sp.]|jgi:hypothetical protein
MRVLTGAFLASLIVVPANAQINLAPAQQDSAPALPLPMPEVGLPRTVPQVSSEARLRQVERRRRREEQRQQRADEAWQRREAEQRTEATVPRELPGSGENLGSRPALAGMLTDPNSRCSVYVPGAPQGASVQWSGPCHEGLANGVGEYLLTVGSQTVSSTWGAFTAGRVNGPGMRILSNGDLYNGEFRDGRASGRGVLQFRGSDGSTYEGEFRDDLPSGQGTRTWRNGARYAGRWVAGVPHGVGTMNYGNGTSYAGGWQNGQRNGTGTMNYGGDITYEGEWVNDQRSGIGTYRWSGPNGISGVYVGAWRNDMRNGLGSEILTSQNARIDGSFVNDRAQGRVVYTSAGRRFDGEIYDGCLRSGGRVMRVIMGGQGECR